MKNMFMAMAITAMPLMAAQAATPAAQQIVVKDEILHIKVNGMVCDFCARSVEKTFSKRKDVSKVSVDLDKGFVTLALKPNHALTDAKISSMFLDAGYKVTGIHHIPLMP